MANKTLITLGAIKNNFLIRVGLKPIPSPLDLFHSTVYQRINYRRLEHLSSLGLDISNHSVLEVGAGIGDLTSFFIDRGCIVATSDARKDNVALLRSRYPNLEVLLLDLDNPPEIFNKSFDIVFCYGLLYHLKNPAKAIEFMSRICKGMLLLESRVSLGGDDSLNPCHEDSPFPTESVSGRGCRPTRKWVHNRLKQQFEFIYMPTTQPWHEEFPVDWTLPDRNPWCIRAIFIASRRKIINSLLTEDIPSRQIRLN
jgi:SAM-dependent methyltransferase